MRYLLFLSFVAFGLAQDENCTLTCNDRGTCSLGNNLVNNDTFVMNGQPLDENGYPVEIHNETHCECERGFTGVNCNVSAQFCDGNEHFCYHGGICVKGVVESTAETVHVCDCRLAKDENGTSYLGTYCQLPSPVDHPEGDNAVPLSDKCDEFGERFCINGGTCLAIYAKGGKACDCPVGYTGHACEFLQSHVPSTPNGECKTHCYNGGHCEFGFRNATYAETTFDENFDPHHGGNDSFEHCQCPKGFSGALCERKHEECGHLNCFHGSTCTNLPVGTGSETRPVCSCQSNATHSFAGLGCEKHSTSFCTTTAGVNGHQFCTNQGQCKSIGNDVFNCTCVNEYHGPHCEFPGSMETPEHYKKCSLNCLNKGKCAEGYKDYGILGDMPDIGHLINTTKSPELEHCICPRGTAGDLCEHIVQVCPKYQHVCFHGSQCVPSGQDFKCDCDTSQDKTAGSFCQHKATTTCDAASRHFCVNGGTCNGETCECPSTYRGPRCEFKKTDADFVDSGSYTKTDDYKEKANKKVIISSAIVGVVAILAVIITVIVTGSQGESPDPGINVPPVTAFPPAHSSNLGFPESSNGSSYVNSSDVADGSAADAEPVDAVEDDEKAHVNEII